MESAEDRAPQQDRKGEKAGLTVEALQQQLSQFVEGMNRQIMYNQRIDTEQLNRIIEVMNELKRYTCKHCGMYRADHIREQRWKCMFESSLFEPLKP